MSLQPQLEFLLRSILHTLTASRVHCTNHSADQLRCFELCLCQPTPDCCHFLQWCSVSATPINNDQFHLISSIIHAYTREHGVSSTHVAICSCCGLLRSAVSGCYAYCHSPLPASPLIPALSQPSGSLLHCAPCIVRSAPQALHLEIPVQLCLCLLRLLDELLCLQQCHHLQALGIGHTSATAFASPDVRAA